MILGLTISNNQVTTFDVYGHYNNQQSPRYDCDVYGHNSGKQAIFNEGHVDVYGYLHEILSNDYDRQF